MDFPTFFSGLNEDSKELSFPKYLNSAAFQNLSLQEIMLSSLRVPRLWGSGMLREGISCEDGSSWIQISQNHLSELLMIENHVGVEGGG